MNAFELLLKYSEPAPAWKWAALPLFAVVIFPFMALIWAINGLLKGMEYWILRVGSPRPKGAPAREE